MPTLLEDIGLRALVMFMALAAVVGLVAGIVIVARPDLLAVAGKYANRWVSTRRMDRALESWVSLDKWFYGYPRASGGLMLAAAIWIIWYFVISFDQHGVAAALSRGNQASAQVADIFLEAFALVCTGGAVLAVLTSFVLLFRPGILRGLEGRTNLWLSLRKTLKPVEVPRSGVDQYVVRHSRLVGVLLLLGALYILAGLAIAVR